MSTLDPGEDRESTAQLVASKAAMFGFSDGYVVGNSVAKDMNIVMVAAIYRRNPTAVVVLKESDHQGVEGPRGPVNRDSNRCDAIPAMAGRGQRVQAGRQQNQRDQHRSGGERSALVTGKVQAIAGYGQGYVPGVEIRAKKEARIFWYADCGVNAVSNGIIVHRDLLKEDPELIRRFVTASVRGFLSHRQNPRRRWRSPEISEAVVPEIARRAVWKCRGIPG